MAVAVAYLVMSLNFSLGSLSVNINTSTGITLLLVFIAVGFANFLTFEEIPAVAREPSVHVEDEEEEVLRPKVSQLLLANISDIYATSP